MNGNHHHLSCSDLMHLRNFQVSIFHYNNTSSIESTSTGRPLVSLCYISIACLEKISSVAAISAKTIEAFRKYLCKGSQSHRDIRMLLVSGYSRRLQMN